MPVAAGRIKAGDEINFAVPTGNFGDILAGYYAKMMGLPVHKFICASNSNNVLTDFINTGIYDKRREFKKTISPSMDILVSSNLERLLYSVTDEDSEKVTEWMQQLNTEGVYNVGEKIHKKITSAFFGAWVDEQETMETIRRIYNDNSYLLDPHTAVAWRACEKYRLVTSDDRYAVVVSTASPYKFSGSVYEAVKTAAKNYILLTLCINCTSLPVCLCRKKCFSLKICRFCIKKLLNRKTWRKQLKTAFSFIMALPFAAVPFYFYGRF